MGSCHHFGKTLYDSVSVTGANIPPPLVNIDFIKQFIGSFDKEASGVWRPVIIQKNQSYAEYGSLLGNPQNIDDSKVAPCNCSADGNKVKRNVSFAYNDLSDEQEDGVYCEYCQELQDDFNINPMSCRAQVEYRPKNTKKPKTNLFWPLSDPITDPPTGEEEIYVKDCCKGGCDTRMKTDDITPKIPYLYNNYLYKLFDFKYMKQFPAIENPGLGREQFVIFNNTLNLDGIKLTNMNICIDWTLKARMGEIPVPENETYHTNLYAHKKSYSRYLSNNKTAGNFILEKVRGKDTIGSISQWQFNTMPLLSGYLTDENKTIPSGFLITPSSTGINDIIPKTEEFTIPYGITDDTHYNIFLKADNPKNGGYWKWNYTSGVLFWYRYYDIDRKRDNRIIPGIDLYISDGDVFFAENDGPEPLPLFNNNLECTPKACPSGLKLTNYQVTNSNSTVTIVPSGSEFIYISANLYERVHEITEKLYKFYGIVNPDQKTFRDVFNQAAILATGPSYDQITIDLYQRVEATGTGVKKEFVDLINEINWTDKKITLETLDSWLAKHRSIQEIEKLNQETRKNMLNKRMVSHNGINIIENKDDLIRTLSHKYGCYGWIPPNTQGSMIVDKEVRPHATLDVNFEPVVKLKDAKSSYVSIKKQQPKSCDALRRGTTKIFSYDQYFSIGDETYLETKSLSQGLSYNTICNTGSVPAQVRISEVGNVVSVYFRDKEIFSKGFNNFQTTFEDLYSRFPSVSSTLDSTFSDLSSVVDASLPPGPDDNVFFLNPDRLLRFTRVYDAIAYNPSIDLVAFHEEGGSYYDSTFLTKYPGTGTVSFITDWKPSNRKENPKISFKTYDLGIKVYGISSESLRNADNLLCKTMPLDQTCNCWGLNKVENFDYKCVTNDEGKVVYETPKLFTPFLSTKNIPFKAYGGYSEEKVQEYLGSFRFPSHPSPGQNLVSTVKEIDPVEVNGCKNSFTFTLPNYVSGKWKVKIPNLDPQGAEIWVSFTDSYGFAGNIRNQNRIVINGQTIFPNEQAFLSSPSEILEIEIHNQLLTSIFGTNDVYLYTPAMFGCSNETDTRNTFTTNVGPSYVTITIGRVPKVNILSFAMPGVQAAGKLKRNFFDPNLGFVSEKETGVQGPDPSEDPSKADGSALYLNRFNGLFNFDYDQDFDPVSPGDITYSGAISLEQAGKISRYVNLLDYNKKIRLYFKIDDAWHEYEDNRSFGYYNTQDEVQYHSWPTFFRETHVATEEAIGPFIPAIPKVPLYYRYINNTQHWIGICQNDGTLNPYPYSNLYYKTNPENSNEIIIKGSRMFFMLPNVKNDSNIVDHYIVKQNNQNIYNISNENSVLYDDIMPSGLEKTLHDFVLDGKIKLYAVDSKDVKAYNLPNTSEGSIEKTMPSFAIPAIPIRKKLIVKPKSFYNNYEIKNYENFPLGNSYLDIYTVLTLQSPLSTKEGYVGIYDFESKLHNFTIFPTTQAERMDYNDLIHTPLVSLGYSSKWGDLYYNNNTADILNNRPYYYSLDQVYGPTLYDNVFNYIIANNFSYSNQYPTESGITNNYFDYVMHIKNNTYPHGTNITFNNPALSYYIHNDYSLDDNNKRQKNSKASFNLSKNSSSILDINIYNSGQAEGGLFSDPAINIDDYAGATGILSIKGINRPQYSNPIGIRNNRYNFFVNLNSNFQLKPLAIKNNATVYSKSFVLTDPYAKLAGLKLVTKYNENVNLSECTNVIVPGISMPPTNVPNTPFSWSNYKTIYSNTDVYTSYPIYCDVDQASSVCGGASSNKQCSMSVVGSVGVGSIFATHLYKYKQIEKLIEAENNDEIEFALSVDAGLYCPLFIGGAIPYIVRSEIGGYSALFPNNTLKGTSDCIQGASYPRLERGLTVWDDIYQYEVSENIIGLRTIDTWANEMIFRSIHGSKQKINFRSISKHSVGQDKSYNSMLSELLNSPKNNISSIYDYIPYDYDKKASLKNINVEGSFRIIGPGNIGDEIKITFNKNVFTIKIVDDDGKAIIAECKELGVKGLLHQKLVESTSIYIREKTDGEIDGVVDFGIEETVVDTCHSPSSTNISTICKGTFDVLDQQYYANCTMSTGEGGRVELIRAEYNSASACPFSPIFDTFRTLENALVSIPSQVYNEVPCSAFSIETATPEDASDLDSFLTKWGVGSAVYGGLGGGKPLECGNYAVYPCSIPGACCDNKTNIVKRLSYRIKNCHYDFIMRGIVSNSLYNTASYTVTTPGYTCIPRNDSVPFTTKTWDLYNKCCSQARSLEGCYQNCPEPDAECVAAGIGLFSQEGCCGQLGERPTTCVSSNRVVNDGDCNEDYVVIKCTSPSTTYEIVQRTIKTQSPTDYLANCNKTIGIFSYDNNEVKLSLGIRKLKTISNQITGGQGSEDLVEYNGYNCKQIRTNGCPYIKVELPNNLYGVDEYQNTQCQSCSTKSETVEVTENPEWLFRDDPNICVLGAMLVGSNPNKNTTVGINGCYAGGSSIGGLRECGTWFPYIGAGNLETLWHTSMGNPLLGSDGSKPSAPCQERLVARGGKTVAFPSYTSNAEALEAQIEAFKFEFEQRFNSKYYCSNRYGYRAEDLIEGVIPGSCSLNFSTVSFPATNFKLKATLAEQDRCSYVYNIEETEGSVDVLVAYMSYTYRRPVSLTDKIIDELGPDNIASSICNTYFSAGLPAGNCANGIFNGHFTNVKEKIISKLDGDGTCDSSPQCYDKVRPCDPSTYCCKVDIRGDYYLN